MSEEIRPVLWLIDEDESELRIHRRYLQNALTAENVDIAVQELAARPHKDDYYDILQDPRTVGIVVDQRLNERRGIDHTGIQLAIHFRALVPQLPIYILTAYAGSDEFEGGEWSVEDIISKDDMHDAQKRRTFASRLLRHINAHQQILDAKAARFHELLIKWLDGKLTKKEQRELDSLRAERVAVIAAAELDKLTRLEHALAEVKHLRATWRE